MLEKERIMMKFSNFVLEKTGKELSSLNNKEIYIQLLNYQFTPSHEQALLMYYKLAHGLGLIEKIPEIEFVKVIK